MSRSTRVAPTNTNRLSLSGTLTVEWPSAVSFGDTKLISARILALTPQSPPSKFSNAGLDLAVKFRAHAEARRPSAADDAVTAIDDKIVAIDEA